MTLSHSSGVMRWKIWSRRMPALFTTMSMRPKWSIAACTIFCAEAQVATLSAEISDWPPFCAMIALVCCAGVASCPSPETEAPTSLMMTLAPWPAIMMAISRPMPLPAPVTIATLPSSMFGIWLVPPVRSCAGTVLDPASRGVKPGCRARARPLISGAGNKGASVAQVTLDGVGKTYRGRTGAWEAVRDFSLEIEEGEFFCLLGTSGCGKTTVLNMVAGFEQPTAGRILLDGVPVERPGADRGVVFQGHDSLYDWLTALDNIAFGLRIRGLSPPRAPRQGRALPEHGRADRAGRQAPFGTLGRDEAAHPDRARTRQRPAHAADGRALRRAGRHDARRAAGRTAAASGRKPARPCCSSPTTSRRRWHSPPAWA